MSAVWIVVIVSGTGTLALKATGPVLLGGKPLPERLTGVVGLLGPALLAALVAIGTYRALSIRADKAAVAAAPPAWSTEAAANCADPANVVADITTGTTPPMPAARASTP